MDMLDAMRLDITDGEMAEHARLVDAVDRAHDSHDGVTDAEEALAGFLAAHPVVSDYYEARRVYHRTQSDIAELRGDDIFAPFAR